MKEGRKKNIIFKITNRSVTSTKINVVKNEVLNKRENSARRIQEKVSIKISVCKRHEILSRMSNINYTFPKQTC